MPRAEKEMAARAEALRSSAPPPPPSPPDALPPPPPPDGGELPSGVGAVKIGFSMVKKSLAGAVVKKAAAPPKRPAAMAFGDDSD